MAKTQKYGISFPINIKSPDKTMLDLNKSKAQMVKSELLHVLFTPKGQRLRQPLFGCNLIQFIFDPADRQTWDDVLLELKETISQQVPDCILNNISIYEISDGLGLVAQINYSVKNDDGTTATYETVVNL
jgi:phage baseplate assembly protein W